MDYIEVSAKTVNDAIMKACMDLGLPSDALDIQVISEGSKGFLGIGGKPAVIKVSKKAEKENTEAPAKKAKDEKIEVQKAATEEVLKEVKEIPATEEKTSEHKKSSEQKEKYPKKRNNKKNYSGEKKAEHKPASEKKREVKDRMEVVEKTEEEIAAMKASAEKFLTDVFGAMNLSMSLNMNYVKEGGCLEIDFSGDDMGVLIGYRGQTLDSLQYLTSLVVNKGQKDYVRVKLDTEDYRRRRKETLENLAKNIANKVRKTRKPVVLEPMNPYERRIIHSALQPNKYVETYSEGNEPYRHVVVTLKKL